MRWSRVLLINGIIATLASGLFCPVALAGGREGNGGDGIRVGDSVYLLDLREAGLEEGEPYARYYDDASADAEKEFVRRINEKFEGVDIPKQALAEKLADIFYRDRLLAFSITKAIEYYGWRFVNDPNLKPIPDAGDSMLQYGQGDLVQLAIRDRDTIQISTPWFKKMNDKNKVALFIHEAVYALVKPEPIVIEGRSFYHQSSERVRRIVGYLFSQDLFKNPGMRLAEIAEGTLPLQNNLGSRDKWTTAPDAPTSVAPIKETRRQIIFNARLVTEVHGYFMHSYIPGIRGFNGIDSQKQIQDPSYADKLCKNIKWDARVLAKNNCSQAKDLHQCYTTALKDFVAEVKFSRSWSEINFDLKPVDTSASTWWMSWTDPWASQKTSDYNAYMGIENHSKDGFHMKIKLPLGVECKQTMETKLKQIRPDFVDYKYYSKYD